MTEDEICVTIVEGKGLAVKDSCGTCLFSAIFLYYTLKIFNSFTSQQHEIYDENELFCTSMMIVSSAYEAEPPQAPVILSSK